MTHPSRQQTPREEGLNAPSYKTESFFKYANWFGRNEQRENRVLTFRKGVFNTQACYAIPVVPPNAFLAITILPFAAHPIALTYLPSSDREDYC